MPWWSVLRDGLRRPRAGSSAAADQPSVQRHSAAPEPGPATSFSPPAEQAWQELPPLQRTLAEPIEPAAPLDVFTGSLVAHHNPSFLAPLGHRVDPGAGGLVDGLADLSPGHPISYSAAGELAVPHATGPAVQRKFAVQRTLAEWPSNGASWLGGNEVDTVPMERPGVASAGGVVTGRGTGDAPLALAAPTPSPVPPRLVVQRHAVAAGEPEEPADPGTAGMEAMEGLTVSRLAEPTALSHPETQLGSTASSNAPTLGRTGEDGQTGPDSMPLAGRTSVPRGGGISQPVADRAQVAHAAGLGVLPTAPLQRHAAPAADLGVRRTWPVVPDQALRAAAFPALPVVELSVARSAASNATQADAGATPDLGPAGAESAASGGAEPTDAPLSGFAAAISALGAGDEADPHIQRAVDSGVERLDGSTPLPVSRPGVEGSASTPAGRPVQRLAAGPGEFVQPRQAGFEQAESSSDDSSGNDSVPPALRASAPDGPTLGAVLGAAGLASEATPSPDLADGQLVTDDLPELPVVPPDRSAAARGSVAMPVVGSAPVQRSAADRSGSTPVPTAGLLASRVPTLQLQQLSSATPAPPPVQRVTFLADAVPPGARAQRLPASVPPATTAGHGAGGAYGSGGVDSTDPATQSARTLQRSIGSSTSSPHSVAAAAGSVSGDPASRAHQFDAFEPGALGDSVRWEPVPLEQATDDESPARADHGFDEQPVVQRAVEVVAGPAGAVLTPGGTTPPRHPGAPIGTMSEYLGGSASADTEVVALDTYEAAPSVEPAAPPRHSATVMPPMPIVQRHTAAAESAVERPYRSSAGISFTSMFSAPTEAAETGYTTVQLHADESSPAIEAAEPDAAPVASTEAPSVQREGEAPPPSTPAPGAAPAGGGLAGADLDEMARRLFEPLSARLRAEFWLDRERAGLMTDARP